MLHYVYLFLWRGISLCLLLHLPFSPCATVLRVPASLLVCRWERKAVGCLRNTCFDQPLPKVEKISQLGLDLEVDGKPHVDFNFGE